MEQKFGDKLGALDLTDDEIKRLGECMKDDKFMDLLRDYTMAISDPENKKKYEEEIAMLEMERGNDVKFIHPCPGHVLKTSKDGQEKCFINICSSPTVGKPVSKPTVQGSTRGMQWSIPHSLSQPREDKDKAGGSCFVYDVVFHPDTYHMSEKNTRFRKMIHDMALDAVERLFKVTLDKVNIKKPKMKFKGLPQASIIRTPREDTRELDVKVEDGDDPLKFPYPPFTNGELQQNGDLKIKLEKNTDKPEQKKSIIKPTGNVKSDHMPRMQSVSGKKEEYVEPKYTLTHRGYFDMKDYYNTNDNNQVHSTRPRELILNIELPMLKAASALHLEIFEKRVFLECAKPVKYKLDLKLPYGVDDSKGHARFDKSKRRLTITLEVLPPAGKHSLSSAMSSNGNERACESCPQEGGESQEEEENEDPLENDLIPSDHPSGLVHGRTQCRHQNHGALWDIKYERDWKQDTNLEFLFKSSPLLIEKLMNYQSGKKKSKISKIRPQIYYHQDEAYITIIVNIKLIDPKKLWYVLSPDSLQFSCMTEIEEYDLSSKHNIYQFYIGFNEKDIIDPRRSRVDISNENAVFLLRKHICSWHEWQTMSAGFDHTVLKTLSFATEKNINNLISSVKLQVQKNQTQEFECEDVSDENNLELLVLKLLPKEIKDEERLHASDEQLEHRDINELPSLSSTLSEVSNIKENKGKVDIEKILLKTLNPNQVHSEAETDEDDDSDTYETADSSSEEDKNPTSQSMKGEEKSYTVSDSNVKCSQVECREAKCENAQDQENDAKLNDVFAKVNANASEKITQMRKDAQKKNETIVFKEFKKGGSEEQKTYDNHSTHSLIHLNNEMLFETD